MSVSTSLFLRGIAALILGVVALLWPGLTIAALVILFGVYACADGIANLVASVKRSRADLAAWPFALQGVAGLAAGVLALTWPVATAFVLVMLVGVWALAIGVLQLVAAARGRASSGWLLALSGVLSIVFGALIWMNPTAGAVAIAWMVGFYALALGMLLIGAGMRLRSEATAAL